MFNVMWGGAPKVVSTEGPTKARKPACLAGFERLLEEAVDIPLGASGDCLELHHSTCTALTVKIQIQLETDGSPPPACSQLIHFTAQQNHLETPPFFFF